jgi:drug/metabolite transporter (DMT)-like permease
MGSALRPRDLGLFTLLSALWGVAFMFNALGLRSFSPFLFAAFRFDLAALALVLVVLWRRPAQPNPVTRADWQAVVVGAVFLIAAHNAVFLWGQKSTTAGVASVIVGLNPLLTTAISGLLLRHERLSFTGWLGLIVGFGGIVLLTLLKPGTTLDAKGFGEGLIVVSVLLWALGSVWVQRLNPTMDLVGFTAWQCIIAAPLLHICAVIFEHGGQARWDAGGTASLLFLAWVASGLGLLMYFTLANRIGPIRVNLWSYVAPMFAMAAGAIVLSERVEVRSFLALALIAAGFALVVRSRAEPSRSASPSPPVDLGPE